MIVTPWEAENATVVAQKQRFDGLRLLQIDRAKATQADLQIYDQLKACVNGADYDEMLTRGDVHSLFCRHVLFFGAPPP